jgi:uncharacterized membrane protein
MFKSTFKQIALVVAVAAAAAYAAHSGVPTLAITFPPYL